MYGRLSFAVVTGITILAQAVSASPPGQVEITVAAMHCRGCGQKIAARLYTVPGVKSVDVDVNRRTLVVVPQAEKSLSPRQLCEAVEHTGNRPAKVVSSHGTLILEYRGKGKKNTLNGNDQTQVVVESMHCKGCAQKIASRMYTVSGVKAISVAVSRKTLYVTPVSRREISLWGLWEAVKSANNRALEIRGPAGSLREAKSVKRQQLPEHVVR